MKRAGEEEVLATPMGRGAEVAQLAQLSPASGPHLAWVTGPGGMGVSTLLRSAFPPGAGTLRFDAFPLTEESLFGELEEAARQTFGEVPMSRAPGLLPLGGGQGRWSALFMGIVERVESVRAPLVVVLDGCDHLLSTRRQLGDELGEFLGRLRARALPVTVVLGARDPSTLEQVGGGSLPPDLHIRLGPLPLRVAGWGHGAVDSGDAFRRWAILGNHPGRLPRCESARALRDTVVERVLSPEGDLWDLSLIHI